MRKLPMSLAAVAVAAGVTLPAMGSTAAAQASGQPLRMDLSFGHFGRVLTPFGTSSSRPDAVAVQPDGKTVVKVWSYPSMSFEVARYLPDGKLDPSFGHQGRAETAIAGADVEPRGGLVVQADGKILLAGTVQIRHTRNSGQALVRYLPNGSLDQSFGSGGHVLTPPPDNNAVLEADALAVRRDGTILVAGDYGCSTCFPHSALVRYTSDGHLDSRDGLAISVSGTTTRANAIAVQRDGKIVLAGETLGHSASGRVTEAFSVERRNPDGTFDQSFGNRGSVLTSFGPESSSGATAVRLALNGKITLAGWNESGQRTSVLARYNPNGSLDQSFGINGKALGDTRAVTRDVSLVSNPDGTLVVGNADRDHQGSSPNDMSLTVVSPDGRSHASPFLVVFRDQNETPRDVLLTALALGPDGKLVAVGPSRGAVAVARFLQPRPASVR